MSSPSQATGKVNLQALLRLALDRSTAGRTALAQTIADICLAEDRQLNTRQAQLVFDILYKVIHGVEMRVRRDLAQRLASRGDVPRELIVTLANDQIDVAYPILVSSAVLSDEDLIAVIRNKDAAHQIAVTLRERLSTAVSDALVDTRDIDVINSLLRNPAAQLTEPTIHRLVDMSRNTPPLQRPLLQRTDLPRALAWRMYHWVGDALKTYITDKYPEGIDELDAEIHAAVSDALAAEQKGQPPRDLTELVARVERDSGISVDALTQALRDQDVGLFEALFARLLRIDPLAMSMIACNPGGEMFAIACKACSFSAADFETLYRLLTQALSEGADKDTQEAESVAAYYDRLEPSAARKVVVEWRRTPAVAWHKSS